MPFLLLQLVDPGTLHLRGLCRLGGPGIEFIPLRLPGLHACFQFLAVIPGLLHFLICRIQLRLVCQQGLRHGFQLVLVQGTVLTRLFQGLLGTLQFGFIALAALARVL